MYFYLTYTKGICGIFEAEDLPTNFATVMFNSDDRSEVK